MKRSSECNPFADQMDFRWLYKQNFMLSLAANLRVVVDESHALPWPMKKTHYIQNLMMGPFSFMDMIHEAQALRAEGFFPFVILCSTKRTYARTLDEKTMEYLQINTDSVFAACLADSMNLDDRTYNCVATAINLK